MACGVPNRMSQNNAIIAPAPTQTPSTAAMIGCLLLGGVAEGVGLVGLLPLLAMATGGAIGSGAGIAKRVGELLPAPPAPVEPWPDHDPAPVAVPVPPAPLPEAPASVNVRLTIDGREVQLTLRDTDEERLLERLQAVLQQYPLAPPTPQGFLG